MGKVLLLLLLVMLMKTVMGRTYSVPRVQMIQRQSCYYTPYDKQLTCQCTNSETNTFLKLKLMFFIKEKGQEVYKHIKIVFISTNVKNVNTLDHLSSYW